MKHSHISTYFYHDELKTLWDFTLSQHNKACIRVIANWFKDHNLSIGYEVAIHQI